MALTTMRKLSRNLLSGALGLLLVFPVMVEATDGDDSFEDLVRDVVRQLDADVNADRGFPGVLAVLIGTEYGIRQSELQWAADESMSWGHIAVLSYERATTGREFEELALAGAHIDFAGFTATMEMSRDRMVISLEKLARMAVRERNSRIFDRLRSSRRFDVLPDLGSGFGLFQEALDFRLVGPPSPAKVHGGLVFPDEGDGGK